MFRRFTDRKIALLFSSAIAPAVKPCSASCSRKISRARPFKIGSINKTPRRLAGARRSAANAGWVSKPVRSELAYAKRALASGNHSELIIQRIADYRADDKADPAFYAQHRVRKAMHSASASSGQDYFNSRPVNSPERDYLKRRAK